VHQSIGGSSLAVSPEEDVVADGNELPVNVPKSAPLVLWILMEEELLMVMMRDIGRSS
jgi:hypothetical protein